MLSYILPMLTPLRPYEKAAYSKGKAKLKEQLEMLERYLGTAGRTFLVGQSMTLADIIVAWILMLPYMVVRAQPHCSLLQPPWAA